MSGCSVGSAVVIPSLLTECQVKLILAWPGHPEWLSWVPVTIQALCRKGLS